MAYSPLQLAPKYIRYLISADNGKGHGIHSPFVFDLVARVLDDKTVYPGYGSIEGLRGALKREARTVPTDDFGAGSSTPQGYERTVSSIAKKALKPPKFGQLFFRMTHHYRPGIVLELGTSLGITTAYLASGNPDAEVITLEGAPGIAAEARRNFGQLGLDRIRIVEGNFDDTLGPVLSELSRLDLVYIDGNHRLEPTLRYFRQMQPLLHADSILIFDDIHWSEGMEEAWDILCREPGVTCSVDLFYIGILFFRKEFKVPQHFTVRF
jgi:predicted O-methyltransferase YrrM